MCGRLTADQLRTGIGGPPLRPKLRFDNSLGTGSCIRIDLLDDIIIRIGTEDRRNLGNAGQIMALFRTLLRRRTGCYDRYEDQRNRRDKGRLKR
ncbi:hypothetical protein GCM10023219_13440 [Stakelama sediminis]